jgi:hypothetical protein
MTTNDSSNMLVPQLGQSGWGVADPLDVNADYLSDGYDTADDAVCAARETLKLVNRGVDLDLARRVAAQLVAHESI